MHTAAFTKSDGRRLWLYGRGPVAVDGEIPIPGAARSTCASHLRWHPLEGEWVIYAAHRQERPATTTGATGVNPLAPTSDPARPTELPAGSWEVAVFENRFPSLAADPGPLPTGVDALVAPALGRAEVVVFAQEETAHLARLGTDHIALVLEVLGARTQALAAEGATYVLAFENRGAEMGVTLHHPHGQIYAYGFLPARQARAAEVLKRHLVETGRDLAVELAGEAIRTGTRLIDRGACFASFVPAFARFPYETWITPVRPLPDLASLTADERIDLACVLGSALRRLDALWSEPMPYLMTFNQAPCDRAAFPGWSLRIEIWPIRRAAGKLKYLAGTELGAGVFASDVLPEAAAHALRAAQP